MAYSECVLQAFKHWRRFTRKNGDQKRSLAKSNFFGEKMPRVVKRKDIFTGTYLSRHKACQKTKESTAIIKRKAGCNHYRHSRCSLSTILWGKQCSMPKSSTVSLKDTCNHCTKLYKGRRRKLMVVVAACVIAALPIKMRFIHIFNIFGPLFCIHYVFTQGLRPQQAACAAENRIQTVLRKMQTLAFRMYSCGAPLETNWRNK